MKKRSVKGIKMTKSARGVQMGDAANIAIRNILSELSNTLYHQINPDELQETEEFFDYKCPYTGKDIRDAIEKGEAQLDHIVPQNRSYCGLNVKGNVIYADKTANSIKSQKNFDDFIRNDHKVVSGSKKEREARIAKIKAWQEKCGYDSKKLREELGPQLPNIYEQIKKNQEAFVENLTKMLSRFVPEKEESAVSEVPTVVSAPAIPSMMKIGQYAKTELIKMLESGKLSASTIANLQDKNYCKKAFGIHLPAIVDVSDAFISERYYVAVVCGRYRICSQWFEKNRANFDRWREAELACAPLAKTPKEVEQAIKGAVKDWLK